MSKSAETTLTRSERSRLRELAETAWENDLRNELEELFGDFCKWADHGLSSLELVERIHRFHDGAARELYKRYAAGPEATAVAYAIATQSLSEDVLDGQLRNKLSELIAGMRRIHSKEGSDP